MECAALKQASRPGEPAGTSEVRPSGLFGANGSAFPSGRECNGERDGSPRPARSTDKGP